LTTIEAKASLVTLINVFVVEPARQQDLVDALVNAAEDVMRHVPGFVSANIHASSDGTRVVNYAQWQSQQQFLAMMTDPVVRAHMTRISSMASSVEPRQYEVVSVHHAQG
jgi:heme-degrading monooxygenase HmoA